MISVLIPVYNAKCYRLVADLQQQFSTAQVDYEIIVAEDGSRDQVSIINNHRIAELSHCRHIINKENAGRAKIRNLLAKEAQGEWLLFMDCDVCIADSQFAANYLRAIEDYKEADIICGGVAIGLPKQSTLRYRYEKAHEHEHTPERRQQSPYLRTTNLMVSRHAFNKAQFDERITTYGHEDTMYGLQMKRLGAHIVHIDNPVVITSFDSDADFLRKTEEALRTLHTFRQELFEASTMLQSISRLQRCVPLPLLRLAFAPLLPLWRHRIKKGKAALLTYDLYRLGYYISI